MQRVLERSASVHTERPISHESCSRSVRRRSILGGIAALFGVSALPKATGLPSLIEAIAPAAGAIADRISAPAVFWLNGFRSGPSLDRILPSAEHAEAYRLFADHRDDNAILPPRDEHSVGTVDIDFHTGGRCFFASETDLDRSEWMPQHFLDAPGGDEADPNGWMGPLTAGEFNVDPAEFLTREEAMEKAALMNLANRANRASETLVTGDHWFVVVQFSAIFDTSMMSIDLCGNVGKASIHLDLAVRIVAPTAEEVARFGKGGAV